jgi:hypothetical protein
MMIYIIGRRTETLDHNNDLRSSSGDHLSKCTPDLDHIFDPDLLGFDNSVVCYIEENPIMNYKRRVF